MKKIILLVLVCLCLCSCTKTGSGSFKLLGKTDGVFDNTTVTLEPGWFIDESQVTIDYKDSVITMPIYKIKGKDKYHPFKVIKD